MPDDYESDPEPPPSARRAKKRIQVQIITKFNITCEDSKHWMFRLFLQDIVGF